MDAVGHLEHLRHVVRDEDDRYAALPDALDQLEHLAGLLHAQRGGRLVEDDHLAAEGGRTSHGHGLALATGQALHGLAHVLQRADAERDHLLLGVLAHAVAVEHPKDRAEGTGSTLLATQEEVAGDVQGRRDREGLVDGLDAVVAGVERRLEGHRLAVEHDLAGARCLGTGQALDQRRLAGAVVADDREDLARVELEVDGVQRDDVAVGLDDVDGLQDGLRRPAAAGRGLLADGGHARALRIHWSTETAAMMRMPTARVW